MQSPARCLLRRQLQPRVKCPQSLCAVPGMMGKIARPRADILPFAGAY